MPPEPSSKRAIAFIDGQNLFYAVKHAFGYTFPNYDASALADAVCRDSGWTLSKVHFYTASRAFRTTRSGTISGAPSLLSWARAAW